MQSLQGSQVSQSRTGRLCVPVGGFADGFDEGDGDVEAQFGLRAGDVGDVGRGWRIWGGHSVDLDW